MSLREEDKQNKNCPSRGLGLGLAAAAIGVGVGAALYYFISKRPENPNTSGATEDWGCDPDQTLNHIEELLHESSFTTISAHSTTDTSINDSIETMSEFSSDLSASSESSNDMSEISSIDTSDDSSDLSDDSSMSDTEGDETMSDASNIDISSNSFRDEMWHFNTVTEEYEFRFDVGNIELPYMSMSTRQSFWLSSGVSTHLGHNQSRERTWSLEECSICFEVILRQQEVMSLPCTHHFHTKCILPWLQQQQTCPNCRKGI